MQDLLVRRRLVGVPKQDCLDGPVGQNRDSRLTEVRLVPHRDRCRVFLGGDPLVVVSCVILGTLHDAPKVSAANVFSVREPVAADF